MGRAGSVEKSQIAPELPAAFWKSTDWFFTEQTVGNIETSILVLDVQPESAVQGGFDHPNKSAIAEAVNQGYAGS